MSIACAALLRRRPLLPTLAMTQAAKDILRARKPHRLALVQVLQVHFILLFLIRRPSRLLALSSRHTSHASHPGHTTHSAHTPHTEHLLKDIVQVGTGSHTGLTGAIECGHAVGIVEVSLVIIVKDVVGFLDGLELDFCFFTLGFGDFVGVTGESGLLNFNQI